MNATTFDRIPASPAGLRLMVLVVLFQLAVLAGELLVAAYPRWVGEPVQVRVEPVDPRDLFRGNYARLGYAFSRVDAGLLDGEPLRRGERVYVTLEKRDDAWQAVRLSRELPAHGLFLRGRVEGQVAGMREIVEEDGLSRWVSQGPGKYHIRYGVEAWFAPKEKALALERSLREGAVATLHVAPDGRAALTEVHSQ